jgi:hypothetical protein
VNAQCHFDLYFFYGREVEFFHVIIAHLFFFWELSAQFICLFFHWVVDIFVS